MAPTAEHQPFYVDYKVKIVVAFAAIGAITWKFWPEDPEGKKRGVLAVCGDCLDTITDLCKSDKKSQALSLTSKQLKTIVIPSALYEKQQHKNLMDKFLEKCEYPKGVQVQSSPYDKLTPRTHLLVVPCIIASRDGADMGATFNDAKLDRSVCHENVIVVVFRPKSPHVPENIVPVMQKMGHEFMVDDMVELVFWDNEFYRCDTNSKAVKQMNELLAIESM